MAKNNLPAKAYAAPHTMSGKKVKATTKVGEETTIENTDVSVGAISKNRTSAAPKGIKIRGTGAATKGMMARGPMA